MMPATPMQNAESRTRRQGSSLQCRMKRAFDLCVSCLGLLIASPLFLVVAALIKVDSKGPVFFLQERLGRNFEPFLIFKFRTMVAAAGSTESLLTVGQDARITRFGRILRWTKIDELPQLINVVRGEMSLTGPRPEVSRYVQLFHSDYEEILRVQPGITDLASLKYRNESRVLGDVADAEQEYLSRILPDKIVLAKEYVRRSSFLFDISLILKTIVKICTGR